MIPSLPTISPECFSKYVGIPFKWNGYDRDGVSCWGLFVLVYREVYGIELPRHDQHGQLVAQGRDESETVWISKKTWAHLEMGQETTGDALHMKGLHGGRLTSLHGGIVVSRGLVIHAQEGSGVVVSRYLSDDRYKRRVIGAYRVRRD